MSHGLPEGITEEILLRLQVVDLLRLKSVCKQWHRIISSTRFIRLHLEYSKANPSHHRILMPYSKSSMKTIDCSDLYGGEVVTAVLPLPYKTEVTFLGTCDGLVCCFNHLSRRIFVWNPATRMCKSLITLKELNPKEIWFHWFGHESDEDVEYKLVIGFGENLIHLINLYAANEDGRKTTLEISSDLNLLTGFGTLFNGRVHCAACYLSDDNYNAFLIFSFDLRSGTSVEIQGPEGTDILDFATMCVINGCLSAIFRTQLEHNKPNFEVWMMKEYGVKESWTKLTTILSDMDVRPRVDGQYPVLCVVGVTDMGDLIFKVDETELMVCNIAEGKSRNLRSTRIGWEVMYVVENLVFPNGLPIAK